jgi:hypothetical protein
VTAVDGLGVQSRTLSLPRYYKATGFTPHRGQRPILYDVHRHVVAACGRRFGKTVLGAKKIEPQAFVQARFNRLNGLPGQQGWIVGPTYEDAEREFAIVYDSLRQMGVDRSALRFVNSPESGDMTIRTPWGFELSGRSAGYPQSLVGEGLDFVLMVEAGRHKRSTWAKYVYPTLMDRRGWSLHTGVPEGSSRVSLLYELFRLGQTARAPDWASYRLPSWHNPVVFPGGWDDQEIRDARELLTDDEFRNQYGAEWMEHAGVVMKEWDDETHLRDLAYNPEWPLYLATDYGYTNLWVLLWIQVDTWGTVYVLGEDSWQYTDTEQIAAEVQPRPLLRKVAALYPEPAGPGDTQILERHWRVPARGGTGGELKDRLALIRSYLKPGPAKAQAFMQEPRLVVDHSCTGLAWEMREGYRWPENRSEIRSDSEHPLDKDNHHVEALGRFFKGHFGAVGEVSASRQSRVRVRM